MINQTVARQMKALAFNQTCASTTDFRLFRLDARSFRHVLTLRVFEEEAEEEGGNEKLVTRGTRVIDKRQCSLFGNN